jgi:hypothetical protein
MLIDFPSVFIGFSLSMIVVWHRWGRSECKGYARGIEHCEASHRKFPEPHVQTLRNPPVTTADHAAWLAREVGDVPPGWANEAKSKQEWDADTAERCRAEIAKQNKEGSINE